MYARARCRDAPRCVQGLPQQATHPNGSTCSPIPQGPRHHAPVARPDEPTLGQGAPCLIIGRPCLYAFCCSPPRCRNFWEDFQPFLGRSCGFSGKIFTALKTGGTPPPPARQPPLSLLFLFFILLHCYSYTTYYKNTARTVLSLPLASLPQAKENVRGECPRLSRQGQEAAAHHLIFIPGKSSQKVAAAIGWPGSANIDHQRLAAALGG